MTIPCAIIDDEPLARDLLESYVRKTPFLNLVGKYSSAVAALDDVLTKHIRLLFLDIQMPEMNGMDFARLVPPEVRIIFTTAFEQYALEGFRAHALDYLMKPVSYADFLQSATKALEWFSLTDRTAAPEPADDFIYVKSDYKLVQIRFDDILYIEGLKDYLKIYLEGRPRPILSLLSMKAMEERLPSPRFLRVHRSFIVQMNKVTTMEKGQIIFDRCRIPVSDSHKADIARFVADRTL